MFDLPEKYKWNRRIAKDTFIKNIESGDKKRYNEAVKSVVLEAQIIGDDLPSVVNDVYNIQVIQFVKIKLDKIRDARMVAKAVQLEMKAPTVITLLDEEENGVLSFATKRLSEVDKSQVVITGEIISNEFNLRFGDEFSDIAPKYIAFDKLINRQDKKTIYQEMAIKTYILSNLKLFKGMQGLLESKVWYDDSRVANLYEKLRRLEQLKKDVKKSYDISEQGKINGEIKRIIEKII